MCVKEIARKIAYVIKHNLVPKNMEIFFLVFILLFTIFISLVSVNVLWFFCCYKL